MESAIRSKSREALREATHRKLDQHLDELKDGARWGVIEFEVRNLGLANQAIIPGLKVTEPPLDTKVK